VSIQATQTIGCCMGDSVTIPGLNTVDMTGWTHQLQSFTDSKNVAVPGVTPTFTVISTLEVDLTFGIGVSELFAAGKYFGVWKRTDANNKATLACFKLVIDDRTQPALTG
jgi:hypothetical protein